MEKVIVAEEGLSACQVLLALCAASCTAMGLDQATLSLRCKNEACNFDILGTAVIHCLKDRYYPQDR